MLTEVQKNLKVIKDSLQIKGKIKIVCISTTANIHNDSIVYGPLRETDDTIAGNIIVRDDTYLREIVQEYDGFVDYFFVDVEIKNECKNLSLFFSSHVKKSSIVYVKPNDFTVDSVDMFMAVRVGDLQNKKVWILGGGNMGSKIALKLAERGAKVYISSRNMKNVEKIVDGLNAFMRGSGNIYPYEKYNDDVLEDVDIIIGTTAGIPVITQNIISSVKHSAIVLDVGTGTIDERAIIEARSRGILVYTGSNLPGYAGMLTNWALWSKTVSHMGRKPVGDVTLITRGLLGVKGDIVVDDVDNPQEVYCVCDGFGGTLTGMEKNFYLNKFNNKH